MPGFENFKSNLRSVHSNKPTTKQEDSIKKDNRKSKREMFDDEVNLICRPGRKFGSMRRPRDRQRKERQSKWGPFFFPLSASLSWNERRTAIAETKQNNAQKPHKMRMSEIYLELERCVLVFVKLLDTLTSEFFANRLRLGICHIIPILHVSKPWHKQECS